jgi:DNA repair protein RecN (Recombination protein N)
VEASFAELAGRIHSARLDLIEVARDLQRAARSFPDDPRRLSEIDERQAALKRLLRRFGPTLDELLAWRQGAETELLALSDNGARIEALGEEIERLRGQAAQSARALSARRREVADQLGAGITAELQTLGMGGARVEVSTGRASPPWGSIRSSSSSRPTPASSRDPCARWPAAASCRGPCWR